jgi:uncharacterized membrane protein
MTTWTVIRFLHLLGVIFFVGGQLMLAAVVAPAMRAVEPDDDARSVPMREVARRFGMGSGVALLLIIATGVAMAGHYDLWGDSVLQLKLTLLVLVFALTGLHVFLPFRRALSLLVLVTSLVIVYLGLRLTWG